MLAWIWAFTRACSCKALPWTGQPVPVRKSVLTPQHWGRAIAWLWGVETGSGVAMSLDTPVQFPAPPVPSTCRSPFNGNLSGTSRGWREHLGERRLLLGLPTAGLIASSLTPTKSAMLHPPPFHLLILCRCPLLTCPFVFMDSILQEESIQEMGRGREERAEVRLRARIGG